MVSAKVLLEIIPGGNGLQSLRQCVYQPGKEHWFPELSFPFSNTSTTLWFLHIFLFFPMFCFVFFARLLKFYLGFHWLIRFATIEERNLNDKKASYINTSWFVIS